MQRIGEWKHTAQATAITNDVVVYALSKDLYEKAMQAKELQDKANKSKQNLQIITTNRTERVQSLLGARKQMQQTGVEAREGMHLRDLGKADAEQHAVQRQKIHQFKKAMNFFDCSIARKNQLDTRLSKHPIPAPPKAQRIKLDARANTMRHERLEVYRKLTSLHHNAEMPPLASGGLTSRQSCQLLQSVQSIPSNGSLTARGHRERFDLIAQRQGRLRNSQPDSEIKLRVLEQQHNRADKTVHNAKEALIRCLTENEESFHRWAVAPYRVIPGTNQGVAHPMQLQKKPSGGDILMAKQDLVVVLQAQSQKMKNRIERVEAERAGAVLPPNLLTSEFLFPKLRTGSTIAVCKLPDENAEDTAKS